MNISGRIYDFVYICQFQPFSKMSSPVFIAFPRFLDSYHPKVCDETNITSMALKKRLENAAVSFFPTFKSWVMFECHHGSCHFFSQDDFLSLKQAKNDTRSGKRKVQVHHFPCRTKSNPDVDSQVCFGSLTSSN